MYRKLTKSTLLVLLLLSALSVKAQIISFFSDSNEQGYYDPSTTSVTSPSTLEQAGPNNNKIPTDQSVQPYAGFNILKLKWTSKLNGDWSAAISPYIAQPQNISTSDILSFAIYSKSGIGKDSLPYIYITGASGTPKSPKYKLNAFTQNIPAKQWTLINVPLSTLFNDPNKGTIDFTKIQSIAFTQGLPDSTEHTIFIDELKTYNSVNIDGLQPPTNITALGYEKHIDLSWTPPTGITPTGQFQIWKSTDAGVHSNMLASVDGNTNFYEDFISPTDLAKSIQYKIKAISSDNSTSDFSNTANATTHPMSDSEFLDMTQRATFRYFWDFAHPTSGLARERNTSGDVVTTGGSGFGVMGILVGIQRGYITKADGLKRLLLITTFLENAERFKGAWPHWMNGVTGKVVPFSPQDNGADLVETAYMIQGLLTVRQYFNGSSTDETLLRQKITALWEAVDWNWFRQNNQNVLYWHWSPNYNFAINLPIRGWNETMIIYILAIASPTHPIPASLYKTGWAGGNYLNGNSPYGYKLDVGENNGGPLFFSHYSYIGFDPRNKKDQYTNYFTLNKNHTLITRAYCAQNPKNYTGYSDQCWGLTASDDPHGYDAHAPTVGSDNGTISPTAALSSMPYTPTESLAALKHFYRTLGAKVWSGMGFLDAFNQTLNWYADSYLAIDQGPILDMIENHRTQLLWKNFMLNPEIQPALDKIGFVPDSTSTPTTNINATSITIYPNPATESATIQFNLTKEEIISINILNLQGQIIKAIFQNQKLPAGNQQFNISYAAIPKGFYLIQITGKDWSSTKKTLITLE